MVNLSHKMTACQPELAVFFAHNDEFEQLNISLPNGLSDRQQQRWKSRQLAQKLLADFLAQRQYDPTLLNQMQRTNSGRPFLPIEGLDFNISHSGDWVALIVSLHSHMQAVGIDIEHPTKTHRFEALLKRYANPEEIEALLTYNQTTLTSLEDRFYLSWCLREALLKAQGVGIVKLAEVKHFPVEKRLYTAHCPQGWLHFYTDLPFYLSYFYADLPPHCAPTLWQFKQGKLQKITQKRPLVYAVNDPISPSSTQTA